MSLNWSWSEKCGEATLVQTYTDKSGNDVVNEFTLSLYTGNACLIMLYEYVEDGVEKYSMADFWADKQHMKNCLGLNKKDGYTENIHDRDCSRITKFKLHKTKCRYLKDIVAAVTQAFDNITIEIYTD